MFEQMQKSSKQQDFISVCQLAEQLKIADEHSSNEIKYLRNQNELQKGTIEQQRTRLEEIEKQQVVSD